MKASDVLPRDSRLRSIIKAISWRLLATLTTMAIVLFVTREFQVAVAVGGAEVTVKLVVFYAHERLWQDVSWGRVLPTRALLNRES